jgi:alpha-tubulin suppressor-like RCC1 family protein
MTVARVLSSVRVGQIRAATALRLIGTTGFCLVAIFAASSMAVAASASAASEGVSAWGGNRTGQLGDGGKPNETEPFITGVWGEPPTEETFPRVITDEGSVPVAVGTLSGVTAVSAGSEASLALLSNGTVWAWGRAQILTGWFGPGPELCESSEWCSTVPVKVPGLTGVTAISGDSGGGHVLALLGDGTVMAWGVDAYGELGNDTSSSPGEAPLVWAKVCALHTTSCPSGPYLGEEPGRKVTAVAAGGNNSMALLQDGTVVAWGWNRDGQLGIGTTAGPEICGDQYCSTIPVEVHGLTGARATAISVAAYPHSLILLSNQTVMGLGEGFPGALPVHVNGLKRVTAIDAGEGVSLALLSNKTVMYWSGESMQVEVPKLSKVTAISGGLSSNLALLSNKTVMTWGGTEVPVPVSNLSGVAGISAGPYHSLAFGKDANPIVSSVSPNSGPKAGGTTATVTGNGFGLGSTTVFKFGKGIATAVNCTSTTECTMSTPMDTSKKAGTVDVRATVGKMTSKKNPSGDQFSYE